MDKKIFLTVALLSLLCPAGKAEIITAIDNWNVTGGINNYGWGYQYDNGAITTMLGYGHQTGPGQIAFDIHTDNANDPVLTISQAINNDSGFAWTAYIVDVFLSQNFTISFPATPVANPAGWSAGAGPVGFDIGSGLYMGTITFTGGTPVSPLVGPDNIFDYTYKITFAGSTDYEFRQVVSPVPEPSSIALITLGLIGYTVRRFRKAA